VCYFDLVKLLFLFLTARLNLILVRLPFFVLFRFETCNCLLMLLFHWVDCWCMVRIQLLNSLFIFLAASLNLSLQRWPLLTWFSFKTYNCLLMLLCHGLDRCSMIRFKFIHNSSMCSFHLTRLSLKLLPSLLKYIIFSVNTANNRLPIQPIQLLRQPFILCSQSNHIRLMRLLDHRQLLLCILLLFLQLNRNLTIKSLQFITFCNKFL